VTGDHDLMLAVRNDDIDQLGPLFEKHKKHLFNFFLLATGKRHASDDLVQEVFLRILKYRHSYREDGSFKVWMFRIARNAVADHFRERSRSPGPLGENFEIAASGPDPAEELERGDEIALLRKALANMSEDKREVLVMSRFQELTYREIGDILECSEGAVKVRAFRAMKELTEKYHELTGGINHEM